MSVEVVKIGEAGTGRPYLVLFERGQREDEAKAVFEDLSKVARALLVQCSQVNDATWEALAEKFGLLIKSENLRQSSFVTFSASSTLVLQIALRELKSVRTIALVDATTRAHPSWFSCVVDKLEKWLPLGLPLRLKSRGFDAKPFLQRLRCPVLVVTTDTASEYEKSEARVFENALPTAWQVSVTSPERLVKEILAFSEVPAKCPQKRAV